MSTKAIVKARLLIARDARRSLSDPAVSDGGCKVFRFITEMRALLASAAESGLIKTEDLQTELVEAVKATEVASHQLDAPHAAVSLADLVQFASATVSHLQTYYALQVLHWITEVSANPMKAGTLAVVATLNAELIKTIGDLPLANVLNLANLLQRTLEQSRWADSNVDQSPIAYIAPALLATRPEKWSAEDRDAIYKHLERTYRAVGRNDIGCGIISASIVAQFRQLALACSPQA